MTHSCFSPRPPAGSVLTSVSMLRSVNSLCQKYKSGRVRCHDWLKLLLDMSCSLLTQGHYRAAKAAMKLGEYQKAMDVIERGLAADVDLPELRQMLTVAQQKVQSLAAARQREAAKAMAERAPAKRLAAELLRRQYKIGRPQLSLGLATLLHALHTCCRTYASVGVCEWTAVID